MLYACRSLRATYACATKSCRDVDHPTTVARNPKKSLEICIHVARQRMCRRRSNYQSTNFICTILVHLQRLQKLDVIRLCRNLTNSKRVFNVLGTIYDTNGCPFSFFLSLSLSLAPSYDNSSKVYSFTAGIHKYPNRCSDVCSIAYSGNTRGSWNIVRRSGSVPFNFCLKENLSATRTKRSYSRRNDQPWLDGTWHSQYQETDVPQSHAANIHLSRLSTSRCALPTGSGIGKGVGRGGSASRRMRTEWSK